MFLSHGQAIFVMQGKQPTGLGVAQQVRALRAWFVPAQQAGSFAKVQQDAAEDDLGSR